MDLTGGYVDPTSKYYIDRLWEEYHKVKNDLAAVRIDASSAWQEYHKMKEELADTKCKLGQAEDYINETLKPELAEAKLKLKMAHSAWDELDKCHAARAMLHDELIIAEGQRDQWKMKYEDWHQKALTLQSALRGEQGIYFADDDTHVSVADLRAERDAEAAEKREWERTADKAIRQNVNLLQERNEWKMKYEAAVEHNRQLRAYNESLVPLAAQELENSYHDIYVVNHDIYVVNKVRQASKNIRETWEDTRARCS
jgi:beta-galactosidase beta subunit